MIEPIRHDWPRLIAEICETLRDKSRKGSTGRGKLAEMMRRTVQQVVQWQAGCRVEHYDGEMLLVIHAAVHHPVSERPKESPKPCQTSQPPVSDPRGIAV
jgi:hypothetical protein